MKPSRPSPISIVMQMIARFLARSVFPAGPTPNNNNGRDGGGGKLFPLGSVGSPTDTLVWLWFGRSLAQMIVTWKWKKSLQFRFFKLCKVRLDYLPMCLAEQPQQYEATCSLPKNDSSLLTFFSSHSFAPNQLSSPSPPKKLEQLPFSVLSHKTEWGRSASSSSVSPQAINVVLDSDHPLSQKSGREREGGRSRRPSRGAIQSRESLPTRVRFPDR